MVEGETDEIRYQAFLSYSHRDAAAAARLHRRLESYRIPRRLTGRETPLGTVPDRLWPVFRDRDELPASSDLSESVKAALARSDALVVLCSPDAAGSRWIAREIETFRALRPDRPVLAAILEGEPGDCFPAALRAAGAGGSPQEPLATDLRPEGDGPQLGLLKLVAGITGLGLDDLVQRDASRRVKRVTAVTIAALIGMLLTAALALVALDARREAERQRAEAEGLIEFMLTDLRDTLKGVGRLDALEAVNSRTLRYYRNREHRRLADESLARRARIIHAIGHDSLQSHDLTAAFAAFHEAHQTTGELLRRAPHDPARIAEHATSEFGLGRIYELRHNWIRARVHYQAFAAAADRLLTISPTDPDYLMKAASGATNLGNIHLNGFRDYGSARGFYQMAVLWIERAAITRPRDLHVRFSQANTYGWLADSFFLSRCWRESEQARMRQFAIMRNLQASDPENAEVRFRLAAARRGLAHSQHQLGNHHSAREHLVRAFEAVDLLRQRDPQNAEWRALGALLTQDLRGFPVSLPHAATGDCRGARSTPPRATMPASAVNKTR